MGAARDNGPNVLVVASDDTTIVMAESLLRECEARGLRVTLALVQATDRVLLQVAPDMFQERSVLRTHVSERQLAALRSKARDFVLVGDAELGKTAALYDVVLTCKLPERAIEALYEIVRPDGRGPLLVAFSSGLDASPRHTLLNRAYADILQANSPAHLERLEAAVSAAWKAPLGRAPRFGVGHPFFAQQEALVWKDWDQIRTIYFLHQSIWPSNPVTRRDLYRFVEELARAHPDKSVRLKLRHLPQENRDNINKEKHPPAEYWGRGSGDLPANLSFDARSFTETLESADLYLSLSSSGIIEGIVHGRMGLFVEGFPGEEQDQGSRRIVAQFRASGMVVDRAELLAGRLPQVNQVELEQQIAPASYFDDLLDACRSLRESGDFGRRINRIPPLIRARRAAGRFGRRVRRSLFDE